MAFFYCVKIAYLLIMWNGPFVQAEQTATPDKVLHRRASGPTPYDIRNVYLEPYEDLTSIGVPAVYVCQNSIYRKYQNDYSRLDEIELTKEQLDELFYSLVFGTLTRFRIEQLGITQTFISVKNFPDGMRYNLESNYVDYEPKFLIGNKLNLGICRRDDTFGFNYKFIKTDNRETIPPLKELVENPIPLKPLGSGPHDIRNVYLEPFEDLRDLYFYTTKSVCESSIYSKYVKSNPSLGKIELTNGQLEELFYDLLIYWARILPPTFKGQSRGWFFSVKNFPDGIRYNLESQFHADSWKFLKGNYIDLQICREDEAETFTFRIILTKNNVPIPPLIELTKTTPISTSTSQTTASQVKTFPTKKTTFQTKRTPRSTSTSSKTTTSPVQTSTTKKTTVIPIQAKDCSFDVIAKRNMTTLTENDFSKNDWIPALHNYNKVDRPSCLSKSSPKLSTACLCTVNRNLKTWVCEDQNFKALEAFVECRIKDFYIALKYFSEVFSICIELKYVVG